MITGLFSLIRKATEEFVEHNEQAEANKMDGYSEEQINSYFEK